MGTTSDRDNAGLKEIDPETGMQKVYLVLSDDERAKGFVRPLRYSYKHVGAPPPGSLRDLTHDEAEKYKDYGYIKFEVYHDPESSATGRFWTQEQIDRIAGGCGHITTMGEPIAATYAREPTFYGGTFCSYCGEHRPVGATGEFIWIDPVTGRDSNERVGT